MKVNADSAPNNAFSVELNPKNLMQSVVRFFENAKEFSRKQGELTVSGWEPPALLNDFYEEVAA